MKQKSVLLIIGGGIAAFKALLLIRLLKQQNFAVRCVLTKAGAEFVTPLSVASLSGQRCYTDLFDLNAEAEMGHIELSRTADLVVCVPATADLIAKCAQGLANDLASTLLLATDKKVLMAPAMNVRMWHHAAVMRNVEQLRRDGVIMVGPASGEMACGEFGMGRMFEPEEIMQAISEALTSTTKIDLPLTEGNLPLSLAGKHILITAGPTHEPIDPVRYLANRSSGKQGYAIAQAANNLGAAVTLVSGPTALSDISGVTMIRVETAEQMMAATISALPADTAIFCAAVADYRPRTMAEEKLKKDAGSLSQIEIVENPDILHYISHLLPTERPSLVVGFAAETGAVLGNAKAKLARKGCDWIVANDVSLGTDTMGGDQNAVTLITQKGAEAWAQMDKSRVAERLMARIAAQLSAD